MERLPILVFFVAYAVVMVVLKSAKGGKNAQRPQSRSQASTTPRPQAPLTPRPQQPRERTVTSGAPAFGRSEARKGQEPWTRSEKPSRNFRENLDMPDCVERARCSANPELPDTRWMFSRDKNKGEDPWDWERQ